MSMLTVFADDLKMCAEMKTTFDVDIEETKKVRD